MSTTSEYATPAATWAAIRAAARTGSTATGIATTDLIHLLLFDRLLARVFRSPDSPFVLKGGTRMLAFLPRARATLDIDLETAGIGLSVAVEQLAELVGEDIGDRLQFTLAKQQRMRSGADQPNVAMVALVFEAVGIGQRVKVDLAVHDRAGAATVHAPPAFRVPLGREVPAPDYVMIAVEQQIADKVAAMMERRHGGADGRSSRAKDLVDLALIAQHLPCDAARLASAIRTQMRDRKLEAFTIIDASPTIQAGFSNVAKRVTGLSASWRDAESLANRLVGPVLEGTVTDSSWNPAKGIWVKNAAVD